jgi:hypothetical protein
VFLIVYFALMAFLLASGAVFLWVMFAGRTREDTTPLAPLLGVAAAVLFVALCGIWATDFIHAGVTGVYVPVGMWVTFGWVGYSLLVLGPVGVWVIVTRKRNGWMP